MIDWPGKCGKACTGKMDVRLDTILAKIHLDRVTRISSLSLNGQISFEITRMFIVSVITGRETASEGFKLKHICF